jgi:hypothetical protein
MKRRSLFAVAATALLSGDAMRSDDLVPILGKKTPPGVGYRQGVIVSYNQNTAENVVLVDGSLVENIPILNTSEAALLAADDVVGIMTVGGTWAILGRFTYPGTPEAVSALSSLRTQSVDETAAETTTSGSFTDLATVGPTASINVGPSGRVLVIVSADFQGEAPRGSTLNTGGAWMGYTMSGANTASAIDRYSAKCAIQYDNVSTSFITTLRINTAMSRVTLREGLNTGNTTFTAKYKRDTAGTASFSNRNITVMAL